MKYLKKILSLPLWVIAIVAGFFSYIYDNWYVSKMYERWAESDGTDSEAYAVFNHHDGFDFIWNTIIAVIIFWILKILFKRFYSSDRKEEV